MAANLPTLDVDSPVKVFLSASKKLCFIIFSFVCILSNAKMEDEYLEEYFKTHERL